MAKKVEVLAGQTPYDIALQLYGSVEGLFTLIDDNPLVFTTLNTQLTPGQKLKTSDAVIDKVIADYWIKKSKVPANGLSGADLTTVGLGDFNDDFNDDFNNLQ